MVKNKNMSVLNLRKHYLRLDGTITSGTKGVYQFKQGMIKSVSLFADASCSIVIDIKKTSYADYPALFTSITASAKPTLSSATKSTDSTLTGWTTAIADNDMIQFVVDSVTQGSATFIILALEVEYAV